MHHDTRLLAVITSGMIFYLLFVRLFQHQKYSETNASSCLMGVYFTVKSEQIRDISCFLKTHVKLWRVRVIIFRDQSVLFLFLHT